MIGKAEFFSELVGAETVSEIDRVMFLFYMKDRLQGYSHCMAKGAWLIKYSCITDCCYREDLYATLFDYYEQNEKDISLDVLERLLKTRPGYFNAK
jgi:hypothetical protein